MECWTIPGIPFFRIRLVNAGKCAFGARTYCCFNGQPVAARDGNSLTFMHGDHLGSINLTDTRVSELRYYPFGETRYSNGTTSTSKRFTSQEEQADIGLYDYGARFYDPTLGRFVSPDSIVQRWNDPQSLNRYAYVQNSPVTRVDPSGHSDICNAYLYNCGISPVNDHSLDRKERSPLHCQVDVRSMMV